MSNNKAKVEELQHQLQHILIALYKPSCYGGVTPLIMKIVAILA